MKRLACIALASFSLAASAMEVRMLEGKNGHPPELYLSGEIVPGDYDRVRLAITEEIVKGDGQFLVRGRSVVINESPGGSVEEARKLGNLLRDIFARVNVMRGCASACFILYASATTRFASAVGIHNPYLSPQAAARVSAPELVARQEKMSRALAVELEQLGVPRRLVETMMQRASNEMYWLDFEDKQALGQHSSGVLQMRVTKCGANPAYERELAELSEAALRGRTSSADEKGTMAQAQDYWRRTNTCEDALLADAARRNFLQRHLESAGK